MTSFFTKHWNCGCRCSNSFANSDNELTSLIEIFFTFLVFMLSLSSKSSFLMPFSNLYRLYALFYFCYVLYCILCVFTLQKQNKTNKQTKKIITLQRHKAFYQSAFHTQHWNVCGRIHMLPIHLSKSCVDTTQSRIYIHLLSNLMINLFIFVFSFLFGCIVNWVCFKNI